MIYRSRDGSVEMHFWLTRGGWAVLCMGRDPMYQPSNGFTLRDRMAVKMQEAGSDYKRPIFEVDSIGYDLVSVFATEYCGKDPRSFILSWIRELDDEVNLGLTTILEAIEWEPYLNGMHKTRFYKPVFEKSTLMPASS